MSNMAFDNNGTLWCTTLDATQSLFRVDVTTGTATNVPTNAGPLNGITNEAVSGNFAAVSSSRGTPPNSIFWLEPNGTEHLLAAPGFAKPSGVSIHMNPSRFGTGSATVSSWDWQLAPNPGGLPTVGNSGFSLTVNSEGTVAPTFAIAAFCTDALSTPVTTLGVDIWVDLSTLMFSGSIPPVVSSTMFLPIPNDPTLSSATLFVQSFHVEGSGLNISTSPGLALTIL
jgi:hypothetical protein